MPTEHIEEAEGDKENETEGPEDRGANDIHTKREKLPKENQKQEEDTSRKGERMVSVAEINTERKKRGSTAMHRKAQLQRNQRTSS